MLTLDRRPGETIIIDHEIEVTVLDISGSHMQINRTLSTKNYRLLRKRAFASWKNAAILQGYNLFIL